MSAGTLLDDMPETDPRWRAPTEGEHVCVGCKGAACYGFGNTYYCPRCVPAGFLPKDRGPAR